MDDQIPAVVLESRQNKLTRRRERTRSRLVGNRLNDYVVSTHPLAPSLREIRHWLCTLTRLAKNHVQRRISGTVALCRKTPLLVKVDLTGNQLAAVLNIGSEAAETAITTGDHSSDS
jgi:hypothetical protein